MKRRQRASLTLGYRRAEKIGFWLLAASLVGTAGWLSARAAGADPAAPWAAAGLAIVLPGLAGSRWYDLGISAWNKAVRVLCAALRRYVLAVSYYALFWPVSLAGVSLAVPFDPAERTRWVPRADPGASPGESPSGWTGSGLPIFASGRGRGWSLALAPVMWLLRATRDEWQENAPPPGTYTLY